MYERRAETRVRAEFDVQVENLRGTCLDLSMGGMRLKMEWSLPVGLNIEMTLSGVGAGNGKVIGRVMHWYSRDGEIGVRFVRMKREAMRDVGAYMREHRPTRRDDTTLSRLQARYVFDDDPVPVGPFSVVTSEYC